MKKLQFYPVKALIVLLSWLPWKIKQGLAFLLFLFLRYIFHYRRSVIHQNLSKSFPQLSQAEIKKTSRKYHLHMAQVILETLHCKHLQKGRSTRIFSEWPESDPSFCGDSHGLIVMGGHTGNWEWYTSAIRERGYVVYPVYKPQSSRLADDVIFWLRSSDQIHPIPMKETIRLVKKTMLDHQKFALLLVSDQTPARGEINFWHPFLNQETPWFTGGEKLALRFDLPVVYIHTKKLSFGRYKFRFDPIQEAGKPSIPGNITTQYIEYLERNIKEQPYTWLWSHRRWKYKPQNVSLES